MKKHFILAAMAMTALFSACSNEDPINEEKTNVPVSFTIGGIDSRATTATDFSTTFDDGDAIGITGTNVTPSMTNAKYNISVSNSEATIAPDGTDSFTFGEGDAIFNAYYPYAENFAGTFTVQTNQNEENALSKSDFLTATAKGNKDNAQVQLDFKHRLVLVQVQLSGISNVSSVTLKNAQTNVTFTNSTDGTTQGSVVLATGDAATFSDIIMSEQTANELYWAIIPAQTIAASDLFIVSTSDGKNYKYTTNAETTFAEGTYAQYKLTLGSNTPESTLVEYKAVIISKWNAGVSVLDGTLEEKIFNVVATLPSADYSFPTGGKGGLKDNAQWSSQGLTSISYDATTASVKFVSPATVNSTYYNNTCYYYAGSSNMMNPNKKYRISYSAKTETAGAKIRMHVCQLSSETINETSYNNILYTRTYTKETTENDVTTTTYYTYQDSQLTTDFTTYTNDINPGLFSNSTSSFTTTTPITKSTNGDIVICFIGQSASTTYYVKDLTITEITE